MEAIKQISTDRQSEHFIAQLREQINRLDDRLITLLRQRVGVARELGRLKQHYGLPLRDPARERAVLARLARASGENGNNSLPGPAVERIFNCIISATLQAEEDDNL
ncbi:MAG TPA: chorismate mutase [Gammaproteobacteria bacterium]|nr:chorismate mutase [Gammaproteobacteria bacterium]